MTNKLMELRGFVVSLKNLNMCFRVVSQTILEIFGRTIFFYLVNILTNFSFRYPFPFL
jgi:hypothetical protein